MHPDTARDLEARILQVRHSGPPAASRAGEPRRRPWIAVGLAPAGDGRARVAVRLERPAGEAQRVRPLRPGLSVAHPSVTAGTLGGFVRLDGRLAVLSTNHVLAACDAAAPGDPAAGGVPEPSTACGWSPR